MNKGTREFVLLTTLLFATRIGDLVMTYLVTPDLARETNPLVSMLGQGWISLIVLQIILVSAIVLLNYYSLFKLQPTYPSQSGLSFAEFATRYYLGREQHWMNLLFRFPSRWSVFVKAFGYTLPRALIVIGLLVSMSSATLTISEVYSDFYPPLPVFYLVIVTIALYFYFRFFKTEYHAYRESAGLAGDGPRTH